MKRCIFSVSFVLSQMALIGQAQPIELVETEFGWGSALYATANGSASTSNPTAGGNPGSFYRVRTTVDSSAPGSSGWVIDYHTEDFDDELVYDPAAHNGITSIAFSADTRMFSGDPAGVKVGLIIEQNPGQYFLETPFTVDNPLGWEPQTVQNLDADDFIWFTGRGFNPNFRPDFSRNGGLMRFGVYFRLDRIDGVGRTVDAGIDNVRITINVVPEPTTLALVDIKPGSFPNSVNLKSKGVLPVAILGTEEFDVNEVDLNTLLFGDPLLIDNGATGVSPLRSALEDVSGDGFLDLTLKFSTRDLVEFGALGSDTVEGLLTGELLDGTPFAGLDSIRIVPPNGSKGNNLQISAVPEPTTSALALAALCLAMSRRRAF